MDDVLSNISITIDMLYMYMPIVTAMEKPWNGTGQTRSVRKGQV